jgi:hypothetical protein
MKDTDLIAKVKNRNTVAAYVLIVLFFCLIDAIMLHAKRNDFSDSLLLIAWEAGSVLLIIYLLWGIYTMQNLVIYRNRVEVTPTIGGATKIVMISDITRWREVKTVGRYQNLQKLKLYTPHFRFMLYNTDIANYIAVKQLLTEGKPGKYFD